MASVLPTLPAWRGPERIMDALPVVPQGGDELHCRNLSASFQPHGLFGSRFLRCMDEKGPRMEMCGVERSSQNTV